MMDLKTLRREIDKFSEIVDGWSALTSIPEIERDVVLEKLRSLYDEVRFAGRVLGAEEADCAVVVECPASAVENPVPAPDPEPEYTPEPEPEPEGPVLAMYHIRESESEQDQAPVPTPVPEPEPATEIYVPVSAPTLFGLDSDETETEKLLHRHKQRVILSLYGVESAHQEPEPAPPIFESVEQPSASAFELTEESEPEEVILAEHTVVAEKPIAIAVEEESIFEEISLNPSAVLGDVIKSDVQTLADTLASRRDGVSEFRHTEPITDLRQAIGLNDKFLLIRDLFNGDGAACDEALEALNRLEDLDDCMIYIAENYAWNSNSDGAKFLMELIERKFA